MYYKKIEKSIANPAILRIKPVERRKPNRLYLVRVLIKDLSQKEKQQ